MNYDAPANVKTAASPRELAGRARFGLEETLATLNHRRGALAVCAVLTLVTLSAIAFGVVAGPRAAPFVPICATVWSLADLLTAFLLLAQFYVKGTPSFGIVAVAFGAVGAVLLLSTHIHPLAWWIMPTAFGLGQIAIGIIVLFDRFAFPERTPHA